MTPTHPTPILALATLLTLGACAPGASSSAQGTQAVQAPGVLARDAPAQGSSRRARTCTVSGFAWTGRETAISPAMTTSNDGYCSHAVSSYGSFPIDMSTVTPPGHGTLTVSGAAQRASFRYTPNPGYEGPDSFTVSTARAGSVQATVAVTVTR